MSSPCLLQSRHDVPDHGVQLRHRVAVASSRRAVAVLWPGELGEVDMVEGVVEEEWLPGLDTFPDECLGPGPHPLTERG